MCAGTSDTSFHHQQERHPFMSTSTATTTNTLVIDNSHSTAEFVVKHMMFSKVRGNFERMSGVIIFDEQNVGNSSVEVEIETASISTRDAGRDQHLRNADFFDAESYPTITFRSTRVEADGDDFKVTGDLTMHGVTREVVLDAELNGRGNSPMGGFEVLSFSANTKINRSDFGLTWNAALETGGVLVSEDVKISLEIEAIPQAVAEQMAAQG